MDEDTAAGVYQAVAGLAIIARLSDHPDVIRILDVLAYGKTEDGIDLLPWPKDEELQAKIGMALRADGEDRFPKFSADEAVTK